MSDPVYFLLHIPKTAGQTIQLHLAEHCAPGVFWQPPPGRRAAAVGAPDLRRVRAAASHHIQRSLEGGFAGREIRRVVLLRDPVALQLSLYNYRMMNYLARGRGTYGFELHLRALPRDFVAHRLLAGWLEIPWPRLLAMPDRHKYDLLNRTLADFWFVGAHSDCDRLLAAIAPELGVPTTAAPRNTGREWRRQVEWQPLGIADLPAGFEDAIRARNPLDQALWESWHDAGFGARATRPHPLETHRRGSFVMHELARPAFVAARFLRRDWPTRRWVGIARADRARDAGDWPAAARHYRAALDQMPKTPAIWVQYGHALRQTGNLAGAEAAYRQSLALDPATPDTHLQLGHVLRLQGRDAEAAETVCRAALLDPASPQARPELAGPAATPEPIAADD